MRNETRADIELLNEMLDQYEKAKKAGATIYVEVLGMPVKHVYRDNIASRVISSISRAIECEKFELLNKNRKS